MHQFDKNSVNAETLELLEPYFSLKTPESQEQVVTPKIGMHVSAVLAHSVEWLNALIKYQDLKVGLRDETRQLEV